MLRWSEYWLKGIDTGVMHEPMLRAWMDGERSVRSLHHHDELPATFGTAHGHRQDDRPRRLFLN